MGLIVGVYAEDGTINEVAISEATKYHAQTYHATGTLIVQNEQDEWQAVFASNKWAYFKKV